MYTAQGTLDKSKQVDQYIPLVRRLAHHLIAKLPASVQIDDLIQAGLIGLMRVIALEGASRPKPAAVKGSPP